MTELTLEQMKANRKLWIEALRSGKYRQTEGALMRADGAMCCLGVLSEIAGCKWRNDNGRPSLFLADDYDQHAACSRARQFVGLREAEGDFFEEESTNTLAELNDSGTTFAEIADLIESEPLGLFVESVQP